MAKKTATMIQRLKKWKKYKGISKEDIQKYGTPDEIKLFEGFEEEHGIEEAPEITEPVEMDSQMSDDLLANLIASADDETLEALLAIIQEELESRGGGDVSANMPDEDEESPEDEALESPAEEGIEDETL